MSIKITKLIWKEGPGLTPTQRIVLSQLASFGGDDGTEIWPSLATLVGNTGLAKTTITATLKRLQELNFITIARREKSNNYYSSNLYTINVDLLKSLNSKKVAPEKKPKPKKHNEPKHDRGSSATLLPCSSATLPPSSNTTLPPVDLGSSATLLGVVASHYQGSSATLPDQLLNNPLINPLEQYNPNSESLRDVCVEKEIKKPISKKPSPVSAEEIKAIFEKLWEKYPVKKSKHDALGALTKIFKGIAEPQAQGLAMDIYRGLIATTTEHQAKLDFKRDNPHYWVPPLPHLRTWIKGRRWEDPHETAETIRQNNPRSKPPKLDLEEF